MGINIQNNKTRKARKGVFVLLALFFLGFSFASSPPTSPTTLHVNGQVNPAFVTGSVGFTATYLDSDGDLFWNLYDYAKKYQVRVASGETWVTPNQVWDSGWVAINPHLTFNYTCPTIDYAGSSLSWNITYNWQIRFMDEQTLTGDWS
ncbi:MAG: hypothetical protein AABZ14_06125, partial [Candidatus Margulisiibacteriota bacterium]